MQNLHLKNHLIVLLLNQILILIPRYCKIRWYWGVIGIARIRLLILLLKLILHIWRIWFSCQYWYCKISWTTIDIGIDVANPLLLLLILILVLQPRVIKYWYWYRDPVSTIAQPWSHGYNLCNCKYSYCARNNFMLVWWICVTENTLMLLETILCKFGQICTTGNILMLLKTILCEFGQKQF